MTLTNFRQVPGVHSNILEKNQIIFGQDLDFSKSCIFFVITFHGGGVATCKFDNIIRNWFLTSKDLPYNYLKTSHNIPTNLSNVSHKPAFISYGTKCRRSYINKIRNRRKMHENTWICISFYKLFM